MDQPAATTARPAIGAEAIARERAILLGLVLDSALLVPFVAIALWSNSLTLMGEAIRGGILMALEAFLLVTLRRIHRGELPDYDYGAGKLEQFGNLMVGTALIAGALFLADEAYLRLRTVPEQPATGMAFAVGIAVVNLGLNLVALRSVWQAGRDGTSVLMTGQIRSRLSKTISSALVVVAVVLNAVFGAGGIGRAADLGGTALVVIVMVTLGAGLWRDSLPPLLDRTLDEARQAAINRVLARHFDRYDAIGAVRGRVSGRDALVEVHLGFRPDRRIAEAQAVAEAVAADLAALIPGARVTVVPYAAAADPA